MQNTILTIILAVLGSGALSALISGIFARLHDKQQREDEQAQRNDDTVFLYYYIIKSECKSYILQGFVDSDGLEVLIKAHEKYHAKGGNGYLDGLVNAVKTLPIKD